MKRGSRIIGIDDSPFTKNDRHVRIVGVVWRDGTIEGVLSTRVGRDGGDATEKILGMIRGSRFASQARAVMMNGIMTAGLNAVDIKKMNEELKVPVIAFTRTKPGRERVIAAIEKAGESERIIRGRAGRLARKKAIVERAGEVCGNGPYVQCAGISGREALRMLEEFGKEPVRIAHLIASGIKLGESHGRSW
ncbi:MAG: DUF99 family protein [Candidatus Micrarchaeota archaeon]|nr:DUF99 family protein [Candidatus Micrarchaeota archaeon]